ncbi:hypothetical protein RFI_14637 [Reticulomyxa filosa]|uniref:PH domain-containing protein n=1 Tax=Reticulomyxa filosa TaxID=46433 RepID=X6N929_RETFI|nr:hypothetical protein RFI_14637 [Reticulomyxa filosa]|eukprot:ETO22556.1 hypothetical protein RFI_14637 [Reticulomyxa filosa]
MQIKTRVDMRRNTKMKKRKEEKNSSGNINEEEAENEHKSDDSSDDDLRKELQKIQDMMARMNKEMEKANQNMNSMSEFMKQLNDERTATRQSIERMLQHTSDINVRASQQITDKIDKEIFYYVVTKVSMNFFDCKIVKSDYVDTKVVFESTVLNFALGSMQIAKDLLNNVPVFGIVVTIVDSLIGTCGDWYLGKLFENVLNFEIKIGPENATLFAKVFGLQLIADEKFQAQKRQAIAKSQDSNLPLSNLSPRQIDQKPFIEVADLYCDRLFAILTTGALCSLWERKSTTVGHSSTKMMEDLIIEIFPTLALGESDLDIFKKNLSLLNDKLLMKTEIARKNSNSLDKTERKSSITKLPPTVIKRGNMKKDGPNVYSQWKKRHFILFSDGIMHYQDSAQQDQSSNSPSKIIRVKDAKRISLSNQHQFCIEIDTYDRVWKLMCSSTEDVNNWIEAINKVRNVKS